MIKLIILKNSGGSRYMESNEYLYLEMEISKLLVINGKWIHVYMEFSNGLHN